VNESSDSRLISEPSANTTKMRGGYYTPEPVVEALVKWVIRKTSDRLLDPSCGDGRFISAHRNTVGIEQDIAASREAMARAPWALVHEGDFFTWAANTTERFDCAAGNPPFIRYQQFNGSVRDQALSLCSEHGARFSALTSSWAPFLVAVATLLKPSGRMAFVVPAEIGHAPYSAPLLEYLVANFSHVQLIAIKEKLFPELSEDCWLLYASGYGSSTEEILLSVTDSFRFMPTPPRHGVTVRVQEWRELWRQKLRSYLMQENARQLYTARANARGIRRLGDLAWVGIGYVTGANDFFHLRPSLAADLKIPADLLLASVRSGRMLKGSRVTHETVKQWYEADMPMLLLKLSQSDNLPVSVWRYLESGDGRKAREAYKCRTREPWYAVPDVVLPDCFLTYMSSGKPTLAINDAGCSCTNSLLAVRLKDKSSGRQVIHRWELPMVELSCELEGHPLGGGMLKLEPREAARVIVDGYAPLSSEETETLKKAVATMRSWRHCEKTSLPVGELF